MKFVAAFLSKQVDDYKLITVYFSTVWVCKPCSNMFIKRLYCVERFNKMQFLKSASLKCKAAILDVEIWVVETSPSSIYFPVNFTFYSNVKLLNPWSLLIIMKNLNHNIKQKGYWQQLVWFTTVKVALFFQIALFCLYLTVKSFWKFQEFFSF